MCQKMDLCVCVIWWSIVHILVTVTLMNTIIFLSEFCLYTTSTNNLVKLFQTNRQLAQLTLHFDGSCEFYTLILTTKPVHLVSITQLLELKKMSKWYSFLNKLSCKVLNSIKRQLLECDLLQFFCTIAPKLDKQCWLPKHRRHVEQSLVPILNKQCLLRKIRRLVQSLSLKQYMLLYFAHFCFSFYVG